MKKFHIIVFILFLLATTAYCQPQEDLKRDYKWVWGAVACWPLTGGVLFNFNSGTMVQDTFTEHVSLLRGVGSICDAAGDLLFYENGFTVAGRDHQVMPHGDSLSYGCVNYTNFHDNGSPYFQSTLVLPLPGSGHLYYIFHEPFDFDPSFTFGGMIVRGLQLSIVDMNMNNGNGDVTRKNDFVVNDSIDLGLTACRHANGRDWWILINKMSGQLYYRLLLSPGGIRVVGTQTIGFHNQNAVGWQSVFSPDGSKFIRIGCGYTEPDSIGSLQIFDFDRCTGLLSNPRLIKEFDHSEFMGCSFSADSKYLYASTWDSIWQYDCENPSFPGIRALVAARSPAMDTVSPLGWPPYFGYHQLGPDGKIYISSNCTNWIHVIEHPELPGIACNVIQDGIYLPFIIERTAQSFPNFRLGRLIGSACDTLYNGVENIPGPPGPALLAYPNPAAGMVHFEVVNIKPHSAGEAGVLYIINYLGEQVIREVMQAGQKEISINVHDLPGGIYLAVYEQASVHLNIRLVIVK